MIRSLPLPKLLIHKHHPCSSGVALVIVLAFVVLLTGLIVAYFSRSIANRQLSDSSAGQLRAATLAQSATDTIIAGFKQEIANGSAAPSPSPANFYYPTQPSTNNANPIQSGAYAVPLRYPQLLPSSVNTPDNYPNLLRRSMRGDDPKHSIANINPISNPGTPSYASQVNSSTDATFNGHVISTARWNSHYLLPSFNSPNNSPSTPDGPDPSNSSAAYPAPDWVLMTRLGPQVKTDGDLVLSDGAIGAPFKQDKTINQDFVVGRYAYAIYDEGGLLDMNVAGHPSASKVVAPTGTPAPQTSPYPQMGFTTAQVGEKGSLAMADLTQLPIVAHPVPASATNDTLNDTSNYLSQETINNIIGWRNYASSGKPGSFPSYNFDASASNNWFTNFAFKNLTGFRQVYSPPISVADTPTDAAFLSRQQLLRLSKSIPNFNKNVLQYMGTFSRSLVQPSFSHPHIQNASAPNINAVFKFAPPTTASGAADYHGNNDAAGGGTLSNQDDINPSFLNIRAASAFPRSDPARTLAIKGEPLVSRKFPLSRLAEITWDATDSSASVTDSTFQAAASSGPNAKSARNHIYEWFGLSRTSNAVSWTYNHGLNKIMRLSEVAAQGRDPDFAELLKAAINVGSVGKAGPNLNASGQFNYQFLIDYSVDLEVLQIMANIIDQFDGDSYPTCIQITNSQGGIRTVRGVEDLPYFYRYHPMTVVSRLPVPFLHDSDTVDFRKKGADPSSKAYATLHSCQAGNGLTDPGQAVYLYVPDVWNPHDANTRLTGNGLRPTTFRVSAMTNDPGNPATPASAWQVGLTPQIKGSMLVTQDSSHPNANTDSIPMITSIPNGATTNPKETNTIAAMTAATTAYTFSDDKGKLFREPTLVYRTDAPINVNLQGVGTLAGPYTDANTGVQYLGVPLGVMPVSFLGKIDPNTYTSTPTSDSNQYICQAIDYKEIDKLSAGSTYQQITFRLEYQDQKGNWFAYDEKYPDLHGLSQPTMIFDKSLPQFAGNKWKNIWASAQMNDSAVSFDPRCARYGIGIIPNLTEVMSPFLEVGAAGNEGGADNTKFADARPTVLISQRPGSDRGNHSNYSNPGNTGNIQSTGAHGILKQIHFYEGDNYSATNGSADSPLGYIGMLSQNDPRQYIQNGRSGSTAASRIFSDDPDGMARRAMGAYAYNPSSGNTPMAVNYNSTNLEGLPMAIANTYPQNSFGVGQPQPQNLSRPTILNRPFRSVAEMGYASRGDAWKQIDFFTPESGDTALLDVFTIDETPPDGLVAGKVNLNTRQKPVLQAIVAGSSRDETANLAANPASLSYAPSALTGEEAGHIADALLSITEDSIKAWRGPLVNVGDMVGHFIANPGVVGNDKDTFSYAGSQNSSTYTYAGFTGLLDNSVYTFQPSNYTAPTNYKSQRLRESAIRALADSGQTRIWNLLIDVVAQNGRYTPGSRKLSQFAVDGECRYWVHVAIDRYTGEVIDKQVELVTE